MSSLPLRRVLGLIGLVALLASPPSQSYAGATVTPPKPASVLWIGNSFTYYNGGLPEMVQALVAERKPAPHRTLRVGTEAIGGAHLQNHATNHDLPLNDGWDLVIVQGYSNEPIAPPKAEAFRNALDVLNARIIAAGSETALFMTWAYRDQPKMTDQLAGAYRAAGQSINARVVPVGLAFANARRASPALALYVVEDNKHPSPAGTYLAACTFFAALYGQSPEGALNLPAAISVETARLLQSIAWQTAASYYGWPPMPRKDAHR